MAHTAQQSDMHHIGDGTQDDRLIAFYMLWDASKYLLQMYSPEYGSGDTPSAILGAVSILKISETRLRRELQGIVRQAN